MEPPTRPRAPAAQYRRLRAALHELGSGDGAQAAAPATADGAAAISRDMAALRPSLVALPDGRRSQGEGAPQPADRARLTSGEMVRLLVCENDNSHGHANTADDPFGLADVHARTESAIRLSPDYIQATLALSDEFQINEIEAASLLYEARLPASRRADRDVLNAARDMYQEERRELILCTQEVLRVSIAWDRGQQGREMEELIRWRDTIVVSQEFWKALVERLSALCQARKKSTAPGFHVTHSPYNSQLKEAALLPGEAILLAETIFLVCYTVQLTTSQALQLSELLLAYSSLPVDTMQPTSQQSGQCSAMTPEQVETDSITYILLLAWASALDRSRFRDLYDPREKQEGVNKLLTDSHFLSKSATIEPLNETIQRDPVESLSPTACCSQLIANVFRMAGADPNHQVEIEVAGRVCALGGALRVLESQLPNWLESGQGSLRPDVDLYAEVFEELIFDITEVPYLADHFMALTINRARELATEAEEYKGRVLDRERDHQLLDSTTLSNLTSSMAKVVSRAVGFMNPSDWDSAEPLRYWAGPSGAPAIILLLGDAVIDLGDIAMRNPDSPGGVGTMFTAALNAFLQLLAVVSKCSIAYASAVITYLAEGGHSLASLEQTHLALSYYTKTFSTSASTGRQIRLSEAESDAFSGVMLAVAGAASVLKDRGGISAYIGGDLPMRITALCTLGVSGRLQVDLLRCLLLFDDVVATLGFLESISLNRCTALRSMVSREAVDGDYCGTIVVLQLITRAIEKVSGNGSGGQGGKLPQSIRGPAVFVVEEILSSWSRRDYRTGAERWSLARASVELLWCARDIDEVARVLLTPAPGTGEAAPALRSLAAIAGMNSTAVMAESEESGSTALALTTERGDGATLRDLEFASSLASKILTHCVSIAGDSVDHRSSIVRMDELLLGETSSLIAVASLIGSGSRCSVDSAHLVLALTANSQRLATALIRDGSNELLRSSLAAIARGDSLNSTSENDLLATVLRIVLACLGRTGDQRTGLFLLGVSTDMESEYRGDLVEYGIVAGLCDRLSESKPVDEESRATAALFMAHVCVSTPSKTSMAIIRYLRDANYLASFRGILGRLTQLETTIPLWSNVCKLAEACMRLVALEVKLFQPANSELPRQLSALLKTLRLASVDGGHANASRAFVGWKHLLGSVLTSLGPTDLDDLASFLCDAATELLQGLSGDDEPLSSIFDGDGGLGAADGVLMCISRLRGDAVGRNRALPGLSAARVGSLLQSICLALLGKIPQRSGAPSTRASLYISFIQCSEYLSKFYPAAGSDIVRRILAFQHPSGQTVGDGMTGTSSRDASMGAAASRAAALSFCASLIRLDTIDGGSLVLTALSKHNRLRKIVTANLGEPSKLRGAVRAMIVVGRSDSTLTPWDMNSRSSDVSSLFLVETSIAFLTALATSRVSARLVAKSGALEHVSLLLEEISSLSAEFLDKPDGGTMIWGDATSGDITGTDKVSSTSRFSSVVSSICTLLTRVQLNGNSEGHYDEALSKRVGGALEKGSTVLSEILRRMRTCRKELLRAAKSICLLVACLPDSTSNKIVESLRIRSAQNVAAVLSQNREKSATSDNDFRFDPLGPGSNQYAPGSPTEARRKRISHPQGGNLFERDITIAKIECMLGCLTAIRQDPSRLQLFEPVLEIKGVTASLQRGKRVAPLADIAVVARAAFYGIERFSEESIRLLSEASQTSMSVSPSGMGDLRSYCLEEFSISGSEFSSEAILDCLSKAAISARESADSCIAILEMALYILREYLEVASRVFRGEQCEGMSFKEGERLLSESKSALLPLAQKVATSRTTLWGEKEPVFVGQMGRDIRTFANIN